MECHVYSSLILLNMIPIRARVRRQCKPWGGMGWLHDTEIEPSRTPYLPLPTNNNGCQNQIEPRSNHDRTNSFELKSFDPFYCLCMMLTHSRDRHGGVVHADPERTLCVHCADPDCGDHASPELGQGPRTRPTRHQPGNIQHLSSTLPYHTVTSTTRRWFGWYTHTRPVPTGPSGVALPMNMYP